MELEILTCLPISGKYEEYEYGSGGELVPIKILDNDYLEYCVKFSAGIGPLSKAERIGEIAFVVAKGKGYLFDLSKRCLIEDIHIGNFSNVIAYPGKGYFVACTNTNLYVFDTSGLVWLSERVSSDGIEISNIVDRVVCGRVFNFEKWVEFKLDLSTFEYQCEWVCEVQ
jgi:hypothetical protein